MKSEIIYVAFIEVLHVASHNRFLIHSFWVMLLPLVFRCWCRWCYTPSCRYTEHGRKSKIKYYIYSFTQMALFAPTRIAWARSRIRFHVFIQKASSYVGIASQLGTQAVSTRVSARIWRISLVFFRIRSHNLSNIQYIASGIFIRLL